MADKITKADLLKRIERLEAENAGLKIRIGVLESRRTDRSPYVAPRPGPPPWLRDMKFHSVTAPADTYVIYNDGVFVDPSTLTLVGEDGSDAP